MTRRGHCCLILLLLICLAGGVWNTYQSWLPVAGTWLDVGQQPTKAEYVMVLGGDPESRPFAAAAILRVGLARRALLSHIERPPSDQSQFGLAEHELARQVLLRRGVAERQITVIGQKHDSTFDEAQSLASFLKERSAAKVLIVTSDFHTRRARWVFRRCLGEFAAQTAFVCPWSARSHS
jgi:uncharacterized SAM-binding protein YcdF (DUF218 family)